MPNPNLIILFLSVFAFCQLVRAEEPDSKQDIYRKIEISDLPGSGNAFEGTKETIVYDTTDLSRFSGTDRSILENMISENNIDFQNEFLFIIHLTTSSTGLGISLDSFLEDESALVFRLEVDHSGDVHNCAMGYYHYGFAVRKDRLKEVRVDRKWFESRPYKLRSYELRQYKEELKQPIR